MSQGMRPLGPERSPWLTASRETGSPVPRPPELSSADQWMVLEVEPSPEPPDSIRLADTQACETFAENSVGPTETSAPQYLELMNGGYSKLMNLQRSKYRPLLQEQRWASEAGVETARTEDLGSEDRPKWKQGVNLSRGAWHRLSKRASGRLIRLPSQVPSFTDIRVFNLGSLDILAQTLFCFRERGCSVCCRTFSCFYSLDSSSLLPQLWQQKYLQTLPNVFFWGSNHPWLRAISPHTHTQIHTHTHTHSHTHTHTH